MAACYTHKDRYWEQRLLNFVAPLVAPNALRCRSPREQTGRNPLHACVANAHEGSDKVAELLTAAGLDINARDNVRGGLLCKPVAPPFPGRLLLRP